MILQDSREQRALPFKVGGSIHEVSVETLRVGDYGCRYLDGTVPPIFFERKSVGDLWGTMTAGYPRFKKEMSRGWDSGVTIILAIEATLTEVYGGFSRSQVAGDSMVQKLFTLQRRHNLPLVFCDGRAEMVAYITEFYEAIGREKLVAEKISHKGLDKSPIMG